MSRRAGFVHLSALLPSIARGAALLAALLCLAPAPAGAQASTPPTFHPETPSTGPTAARGAPVNMWSVWVVPGANPTSTNIRVVVDARALGGGYADYFANQGFVCDDDTTDFMYYSCLQVPWNAPLGAHQLPVTIFDAQGRSSTRLYTFTVVEPTPAPADQDGDGLTDAYELGTGLDATSAAGDNGANGDPDGDGQTNLQEQAAFTHPRGTVTRYFAEGATNSFFSSRLAFFNPSAQTARVFVRTLGTNGQRVTRALGILPNSTHTLFLTGATVADTTYSILIESDQPVLADRVMSWHDEAQFANWDLYSRGNSYGSTLETALDAPSTTWYLAEGATGGPFSLYYLLQNPGATPASATVTYLRAAPLAPIEKTYPVPAFGRVTIDVAGEHAGLAAGDVSAKISSDQPIIVERSMYYSTPTQPLAAGHVGAGVTAPAHRWFLAEGATGFFDEFVLIANAEAQDAQVTVQYLLPSGAPLSETITVAARSRFTIPVNARFPALASTPVSVIVESPTVPVIVERVMWWPHGDWYEASLSAGATATSKRWGFAASAFTTDGRRATYVQIANTEPTESVATVTVYEGPTNWQKQLTLPPNSRTTVDLREVVPEVSAYDARDMAVTVSSSVTEIVVERSMYGTPNEGPFWAAGASALAVRLP